MTERFLIPGRPDPLRSPVGRLVTRLCGDPLQGGARFWLVAVAFGAVYAAAGMLAWGLLHGDADGLQTLFVVQATVAAVAAAAFFGGYRPGVRVEIGDSALRIVQRGRRPLRLEADVVHGVDRVSPVDFHRHYRRFQETVAFPGRPAHRLVHLATDAGPVLLGILPAEQERFIACVRRMAARDAARSVA